MLSSKELRTKAWNSLKDKYWMALLVTLVISVLYSFGTGFTTLGEELMNIVGMVDPSEMSAEEAAGGLVLSVVSLVSSVIGLVVSALVGNAAMVGCCNYFIKNTDSKPTFADAFSGFRVKYGRNIGTLLLMGLKLTFCYFLFIVPGVIKSFEYAMIPYILADDPTISSKEAFAKSKQMMTGNKWRLFKLEISFIGWILLSCLTCGIGVIFLAPYMEAASAEFYVELKNK